MFLSRIAIDVKKYETMRALYNLERLHGMVENSFNGERHRNLWRLDRLGEKDYLLLLSQTPPDNNLLPEQIGYEGGYWETKPYDTLLTRIKAGSCWYFRLSANPTECSFVGFETRGKRKAITVVSEQKKWLKNQSRKLGFEVSDLQFDVVQSEWKCFKKKNQEVKVLSVIYEGVLTVTDANLFSLTLTSGIGREKAFGMGLLTVVPYV